MFKHLCPSPFPSPPKHCGSKRMVATFLYLNERPHAGIKMGLNELAGGLWLFIGFKQGDFDEHVAEYMAHTCLKTLQKLLI